MATSRKSAFISIFTTLLSLVVIARPGAAQSYNAAGNFSIGSNPNGAWRYGYSYGVGSTFILDTTNTASYGPGLALGGWMGNVDSSPGANYPYALKNFTANPVTNNGTTVYQPGQLGLQPGSSNLEDIVRWTAPFSGTFSIATTFSSLDAVFGASVDVHILHNGVSIFNSVVSPAPATFSGPQSILAGDTIDFIVGNGGNGLNGDSTGLSATIVPEPGTLGLVGMGFGCLLAFRFRKRTQGNGCPVPSSTKQNSSLPSYRKAALISSTFTTLLSLVVFARPGSAQSYNAAMDFSATSNPNGTWRYGWSTTLGSAFNLDTVNTNNYTGLGLNGWLGAVDPSGEPYALLNGTGHPVTNVVSVYQPGQLAVHPGAEGQYAIVRWTASSSRTFSIAAVFSGLSARGDSVDVHILYNVTNSLFSSTVVGSPAPASFSGLQSVNPGDTIDFAVGFGSNGDNHEDTTGLSAFIVPEPSTVGLVVLACGCLLSLGFRKRK